MIFLFRQHCEDAISSLSSIKPSPHRAALVNTWIILMLHDAKFLSDGVVVVVVVVVAPHQAALVNNWIILLLHDAKFLSDDDLSETPMLDS